MRLRPGLVACALGLSLTAAPAAPQDVDVEAVQASKRVTAVRISEPIVVDGALDEAAWALAEPAVDFYQQFPDEFAPASERSEVRFLYDSEMLYIGAMLYDDEPNRLIIDSLRRDFSNFQSDSFLVVFDTFLDRRNGYGFNTNAGGAQRDVQSTENGRRNDANWNGAWFTRSRVLENGWTHGDRRALQDASLSAGHPAGVGTPDAAHHPAAGMNTPPGRPCRASFRITPSATPAG